MPRIAFLLLTVAAVLFAPAAAQAAASGDSMPYGFPDKILRALQVEQDELSKEQIPDTKDTRMASAQLAAARAALDAAMKALEDGDRLDPGAIQRLMADYNLAERLASDAIKHAQAVRTGTTAKEG